MDPTLRNKTLSALKDSLHALSPGLKTVAKYIVDHPSDFGLDPIRETARKCGVSTYTLVRMAHKMGFDGYDELREPFRHALVSSTAYVAQPAWLDGLRAQGDAGRVQAEAAANSMAIVQRSLEFQDPAKMQAVANTLLGARNVYLTAVRSSFALAYYFNYLGRMPLTTLKLIPSQMHSAIDDLSQADAGDVLVAITFTPYSRETIEACKFASKRGVKLIMISDSDLISSEFTPDQVLVVSVMGASHFACFSGALAAIENLMAHLMELGGAQAHARIASYDKLRRENNAYWFSQKKH